MEKIKDYQSDSFFTETFGLDDIFTKEDFTDEHQMMADTAASFVDQDLLPVLPEIENQDFDKVKSMIRKSGEIGLLGIDIPEAYGGMELDKVSSIIITEQIAKGRSFSITYSGQVGIGSLPIVYYGSDDQKKRYLPLVASGEKIGSYALTEPDAGTDAIGIKTTAKLNEDGTHYIINGEKQFITNASFADFFILYAKIDGEKFTAFIIDKDAAGLTIGPEEQKMGLKGSSTTSIVLNDLKIPVENVLGEIGRGHSIAFNILNIGRHKISATCLGTSKRALELAVQHVTERKQFKRALSEFSLTKEKIATMTSNIFTMESMVYRTAGEFEKGADYAKNNNIPFIKMLKDYALECSVNKVLASEMLDYIVDEALQLHGGYGFISEYEIETLYRDSRINRIFEGTNEINRIVIANTMLQNSDNYLVSRKVKEGQSQELQSQWQLLRALREFTSTFIHDVKEAYSNPDEEQELLVRIADFSILTYALESNLVRFEKMLRNNSSKNLNQSERLVKVFAEEAAVQFLTKAMSISYNSKKLAQKLSELVSHINESRIDVIEEKRQIANFVMESGN
ncbi:acyl-CoA dehydrogenase family protein [Virgibacillus ainsalahensis]